MSDKISNKLHKDISYEQIIKDIINDNEFNRLSEVKHHETTDRFAHSLRVSYYSYIISKKLGLDYFSAARSGLLHDFFFEVSGDKDTSKDRLRMMYIDHPVIACENAKQKFGISEKEEDAIKSHMFPLSNKIPKYRESWVVMISDKLASIGEFRYRMEYTALFAFVLIMNWFYR